VRCHPGDRADKESQGFRLNREILEPRGDAPDQDHRPELAVQPDGAALSRTELEGVAALAVQRGVCIVSDETYEALVYDGFQHVSIASLNAAAYAHTIVVNSLSKAYAMTGWRLGYAAGPAEIIKAMDGLQGQMTSNPTSFAQRGGVAALIGPQEPTHRCARSLPSGADTSRDRLNAMPGSAAIARKGPSMSSQMSPDSDSYGNVTISSYDYNTGNIEKKVLYEKLQVDDHNAPSILLDSKGFLYVFLTNMVVLIRYI